MRFEFDPVKEQANIRKHGLDFSVAAAVFADPFGITLPDRVQDGEVRMHQIGCVGYDFRVLLVVFTQPDPADDELIRVIGVRDATSAERRRYEEGDE
jgi:uncharacterized DUF497 family protein